MSLVILLAILFLQCFTCRAQYDDVRCKCVCPKEKGSNATNIHIKTVEADRCTCQHIVQREETFCLRCQCSYEARNTLLIKVIVIIVLAGIAALLVYMLVLMIIERYRKKPLSITADQIQEELKGPVERRSRALTLQNIDRRLSGWQDKLSEQRQNVYRSHTMLN